MDLGPVLRAHSYLRVERPFTLWPAGVDDVALVRLLGECIAFALGRGTELADVVMRANNVTVAEADSALPIGDYVAVTVAGVGEWSREVSWKPDVDDVALVNDDVTLAARAAGVRWGYTRAFADGGSVTVLFPREVT
jgi:hypothetical protein